MLKPFAYRPQNSRLATLNPLTKLLLLVLLISLVSYHPLLAVGGLFTLLLLSLLIKLPLWSYRKNLLFLLLMALVIGLSRYLSNKNFTVALLATIRFLCYLLAGLMFTDTTSADDLGRSLARFGKPVFGHYGLRFAMLVELVLRSFTLIFVVMEEISLARRSRLQSLWRRPVQSLSDYTSAMITLVIRKAERLVQAMEIRCFDPDVERETPLFTAQDSLITIGSVLVGVLLVILM